MRASQVASTVSSDAASSGVNRSSSRRSLLIGLLNPVTGVLLGLAFAGDVLTGRQLCGLAVVLAGVTLGRPGRGSRRTSDSPSPQRGSANAPDPRASGARGGPRACAGVRMAGGDGNASGHTRDN
jgi:probable blue pigment (indigoidine) exporter